MKKKVDVVIVLDRSGSMKPIKSATIKGYNNYLEEQRKTEADVTVTLVQFDDRFQVDYEAVDIKEVNKLNSDTYIPRGLTALLDAIGKTIKITKSRCKALKKNSKPEKTIFVIITDGYENNSTKYNRRDIFNKIRKLEEKENWEFVFLGANQDAIQEAKNYGISAKKAMTYAFDEDGTDDMYISLGQTISACIRGKEFEFTDEQREKQKRSPKLFRI